MNHIYNKSYYEESYQEEGGGSYANKKLWYPFFDQIAQKIAETYQPKTVLDAGCAYGYLVEAFRKRGIESYGIDISEYAISHVDKSIQAFCSAQSITEPLPKEFPKKFDLIISIEVLEHLTAEEGEQALKNLCNYTDTFIFSSTDSDIEDITHINVQRKEYWARIFAQNGFFRELQQSLDYISPQADMYCKRDDIGNIIQEYEIKLRISQMKKNENSRSSILYFDMGNGFCEKEKRVIEHAINGEQMQFSVKLPQGIKDIRFDPIEGNYCIITDLQMKLEEKEIHCYPVNGEIKENIWIFNTVDPQIKIKETNFIHSSLLTVQGTIFLMKDVTVDISSLTTILKNEWDSYKIKDEIKEMKKSNLELCKQLENKYEMIERQMKRYRWRK